MTDAEKADAPVLSAGDVAQMAAVLLGDSPLPALLLEVPSERIVASSPAAARIVDPEGGMIVGHLLEEFTTDSPAPGHDLHAGGRLNGFETLRRFRRRSDDSVPVRMWIRSFDEQPSSRFVVAVFVAETEQLPAADVDARESPAVIGTADAQLLIERISSDAEELFDRPVVELLGTSLLRLVAQQDVPSCLSALSTASASKNGVTLHMRVRSEPDHDDGVIRCEALLLPLEPSPSCAFIFMPISDDQQAEEHPAVLASVLARLRRGAEVAQFVRGPFRTLSEARIPGLSRLTTRELEIVTRLLDGDRVPAIAGSLFLSQSTVRNHLSSVFGKLGVGSQQELLHVFRNSSSGLEPDKDDSSIHLSRTPAHT